MVEYKMEQPAEAEVLEQAGLERSYYLPYELIRRAHLRPQPPQMPGLSRVLTKQTMKI